MMAQFEVELSEDFFSKHLLICLLVVPKPISYISNEYLRESTNVVLNQIVETNTNFLYIIHICTLFLLLTPLHLILCCLVGFTNLNVPQFNNENNIE